MQEQHQAFLVHPFGFAETERLTHKPAQPLTKRVVKALDRVCLAAAFSPRAMLCFGQDRKIRLVKVGINELATILFRHPTPKDATRFCAAIPDSGSNNLTGTKGKDKPYPTLIRLTSHETPEFIRFEAIAFLGRNQGGFEWRKAICFFFRAKPRRYCG